MKIKIITTYILTLLMMNNYIHTAYNQPLYEDTLTSFEKGELAEREYLRNTLIQAFESNKVVSGYDLVVEFQSSDVLRNSICEEYADTVGNQLIRVDMNTLNNLDVDQLRELYNNYQTEQMKIRNNNNRSY